MKPRVLVMSQSTLYGGMEKGSISQDLRILEAMRAAPVLALRLRPQLREWAERLRAGGLPVVDYAPPAFLETWDRWRIRRLKKHLGRPGFSRLMARYRPTGLVCYSSSLADCLAHLWHASRHDVPRVLSVHSTYAGHGFEHDGRGIGLEPPPRWDAWQRRHLRQAFAGLRGIRAVSDASAAGFLQAFGELLPPGLEPITIYHGIDTERFRPPTAAERLEARRALDLDPDALVLGTSALLTPRKGVMEILETWLKVRERHPRSRLLYAGDGPQRRDLADAVRAAGVDRDVQMLGHRDDMVPVLQALDVFLLFSSVEGLGWATIEAMSTGLPVVATDVTGTREVVRDGETGFLFPYGAWDRALEPIEALIASPDLARAMGAAGRRCVEQTFDRRRREEKVMAFFERTLF
ncbi:MAG: glycosyltransferase family 4 protein [Acidimicrobiia bacterium]|nr:glycosyltransferase family 4 protein [Acidimicrobiia bacterium]